MCVTRQFTILLILLKFCRPELEIVRYEPLYVVEKPDRFTVANSLMIFNARSRKHVLVAPEGFDIELACPKSDGDGVILETVGQPIKGSSTLGVLCDEPVKPYIEKFSDAGYYSVGFLIYKEGGDFTSKNLNKYLPPVSTFDIPIFCSISVRLTRLIRSQTDNSLTPTSGITIDFGEWIQIESSEPVNNQEYDKNEDIIGFDIDKAYSLENQRNIFYSTFQQPLPCALIKIQLAPAEDFFLTNFKKMTQINMNTAPMWERVLPQWRSLEKFVRKVVTVLGKLTIITGTSDLLLFPSPRSNIEALHLDNVNQKLSVPKYFWKAVISRHGLRNDPEQNYGIFFIMINDPYFGIRKREDRPLCYDVINGTGWDHHAKSNITPE
ncbi:hypothetical protein U1Q18_044453 [Sarracenia purpurea var. burkii]